MAEPIKPKQIPLCRPSELGPIIPRAWLGRIGWTLIGAVVAALPQIDLDQVKRALTPEAAAVDQVAELGEWRSPEAVIDGPDAGEIGRLVELTADNSVGEVLDWSVIGLPHADEWRVTEAGGLVLVADRPCTVTVILAASSCSDGIPVISKATHVVAIAGGTVPDAPAPGDPPAAPPVDGALGLRKMARETAGTLTSSERGRAADLARVYRSMADDAKLTTAEKLAAATLAEIKRTLGDQVGGWSAWYATLATRIGEIERQGSLATVDQWRGAWREIAAGLQEVTR